MKKVLVSLFMWAIILGLFASGLSCTKTVTEIVYVTVTPSVTPTPTVTPTQALPPKLNVYDKWVYGQTFEGENYTRTEEVVYEESLEGKDCYVLNVTFTPPLKGGENIGWIGGWTEWRDEATYKLVRQRFSASVPSAGNRTVNRLMEYSNQITGSEWPYEVGNEFIIKEVRTLSDCFVDYYGPPKTVDQVTTFKVIGTEEMQLSSGNLTCFKVVGTQGGNVTSDYLYSDKAKAYVKRVNPEEGLIELRSYLLH